MPVVEKEGLKGHEIAILIILTENQLTSEESLAVHYLRTHMNKAGYTDVATSVGIKSLVKKGLVATFMEDDNWNNGSHAALRLTDDGENWVMSNQDQLVFRMEAKKNDTLQQSASTDDLPF